MATPNNSVLESTPAMQPPPGQVNNLVNPLLVASIWTWTIGTLAVLCSVGIRLFTKARIMKELEYGDSLSVIATIGCCAHMVFSITSVIGGDGKHQWDLSVAQLESLAYWLTIQTAVYCVSITFAKASVIVPLIQIFAPTKRGPFYWGLWGLLISIILFYTAGMFVVIFECTPREKIWNPFVTGGTCVNENAVWLVSGIWNVLSDVMIVVLPVLIIWNLHMPIKRKVGVFIIFTTTLFALASSVARLYYTVQVITQEDTTYVDHKLGLWTFAEMATLICCSCMPTMPRFFRWVTGKETANSTARPVMSSFRRRTPRRTYTDTISKQDDTQELRSTSHSDIYSARYNQSGRISDENQPPLPTASDGIVKMVQIDSSSQDAEVNGISRLESWN